MKKLIFIVSVIMMLGLFVNAWSAVGTYTFSTSTTGSLVDMSAGTTDILPAATYYDDNASPIANVGFNFPYDGVRYSQFSVNSNGQLRLGSTVISGTAASPAAGVNLIAPLSGDNSIQSTGKLHYKVTGSAPNRILVMEWKNLRVPYTSDTAGTYGTMQALLYENGAIDFIYGAMYNMSTSATTRSVFISNSVSAGGIAQVITIPTTPAYNNTATSLTTSSFTASSVMTNLNSVADGSRRVFTFTPPAATSTPNIATLVSPVNGGTISTIGTLNWTDGGGWTNGFKMYFGTDNPPTNLINGTDLGYVTTYSPAMSDGIAYYWRIQPFNGFGDNVTGTVWNFTASAPLTGIKTINPAGSGTSNYLTFTAAINALNSVGTGTGGVTFNVAAGAVFNEAAQLPVIAATGTAANPIIFQKSGAGANPLVTAPGTAGTTDYIFKVLSGDYITFNGIDVANATGLTTVEMGYWFLGATGNGCQYNTVQNCTITLDRVNANTKAIQTTTVASGPNRYNSFLNNTIVNSYYGIYVYGVSGAGSEDMNNVIQGNTLNNTALYNIYIGYQTNANVNNNVITYPVAALASALYGIYDYYCPSADIHHNTINGGTTSGSYYNIYANYAGSANIYGNTMNGNTVTGTSTYYGYYPYYCTGTMNFYDNTISNLSSTSTASIYGVYPYYGAATHNIYGNNIYNFTTLGTTYGIYGYASSTSTANYYSNKVYNLLYNGTSTSIVTGIGIALGSVNNVYNNMVYDIKAPTGTASATAPQVRGLAIIGGTTNNVYNNSVYLNATGTAASFSTACIYYSSGTTNDQKNNIFINASTPGASGKAVAFWKSTAGFANFAATMNNNIYHAGIADATRLVFFDGTNSYQTLDAYKTLNVGKDQNSYYEDSRFISTTSPYNLHINPAVTTRIEGNALVVATVTTDIDGDARSGSLPDIGADEGTFTAPAGPPNPVTMLAPANDAVGINPLTVVLSWSPAADGGTPTNYGVCISNSMDTLYDEAREVLAPTTSFTPYLASPSIVLDFNTVYYWMIYPGNTGGTPLLEDCPVWSFRTGYQMSASTTYDIGNAWPSSTKTGTFPVQNLGLTPLTFTAAGTDFTFGGPFTVDPQSTFNLPYTFNVPGTEGAYTGQFTLTATSPASSVINVAVTANVTTNLVVGNGNSNLYLPVYPYFGYSYSQTIYYPSEISYPAGYRIEKLYYYYNGLEVCEVTQDFKIYMGHTTTSTFATTTSWIPLTGLTQVYNHTNTPQLVAGGYWMEFVLDTPFIYNGVDNLIIGVEENLVGYDLSGSFFYSTATTGVNRSLYYYSDTTNPDPAAPPTGYLQAGYPNTKFYVAPLPVDPMFSVTPASKDFGTLYTTASPVTQTFTITNTGAGSLPINTIGISGNAVFTLVNMPTLPLTLTAGATATFGVQFDPAVEGIYTATVNVTDGLGGGNVHPIAINGSSVDISGGYRMATSFQTTAPSYPTYNWIDIATTGTEIIGLTDIDYSAAIPLGITFPFFGTNYTEAYVTSNGYMVFGTGSCQDANPTVIPSAVAPNDFISFFWDDMNCASSTVTDDWIKYANVDGNFVITFYKLPEYGGTADGWITGQVILYPSGKIKMQYAAKGSVLDQTSYSTGIENSTGLLGLQYHADLVGGSVFGPAGEPLALAFGTGSLSDPTLTLDAPVVTLTQTETGLHLEWPAVAGATSYYIYTATDPYGTWTPYPSMGSTSYDMPWASVPALGFVKVTASTDAPVLPAGRITATPLFRNVNPGNVIKINKAAKK